MKIIEAIYIQIYNYKDEECLLSLSEFSSAFGQSL
jgi:hypothetical protein